MKNYFALFIVIALIPMSTISCRTTDGLETFSFTDTVSDPDNDLGRFIGVSIKLLDKAGTFSSVITYELTPSSSLVACKHIYARSLTQGRY